MRMVAPQGAALRPPIKEDTMKLTRALFAVLPLGFAVASAAVAETPATPPKHGAQLIARAQRDRPNPREERITRALNVLEAQGYASFKDFRADGKNYAATVKSAGKPMTVLVDPDTGQVIR
jgi:peptidase YpeB-like protein